MHLPCTLITPSYKVDRNLLFSETKSKQGVECETGISDPSESVIPDCQQGIKVQL
jgi:hypothetical protein